MKKLYLLSVLLIAFLLAGFSAQAQYCIPTYSSGCGLGDEIDDFTIEDSQGNTILSHLGTGCSSNAYGDFTSDPALEINFEAGEDYDFEITHGTSNEYVTIWIDVDGN